MSKELATTTPAGLPANIADLEQFAGEGVDFAPTDMQIPFITVLQSMSPQVKKSDPDYIKGAEEGMMINSLTQDLYDGDVGIQLIPCAFRKKTIEWRTRDSGGGFVEERPYDREEYDNATRGPKGEHLVPSGNQIVETAEYYVLVVNADGTTDRAVISMTSSQLGVSRKWNSLISKVQVPKSGGGFFTPPIYANLFNMKTKARQSNDYSWFVFDPEPMGFASPELISEAQEFSQSVRAGAVEAKRPESQEGSSTTDEDDVPF